MLSSVETACSSRSTSPSERASVALARNFSATPARSSGFSGPPSWYGELGLEHLAALQLDPHAAGERGRVGRELAHLVAHLLRQLSTFGSAIASSV